MLEKTIRILDDQAIQKRQLQKIFQNNGNERMANAYNEEAEPLEYALKVMKAILEVFDA